MDDVHDVHYEQPKGGPTMGMIINDPEEIGVAEFRANLSDAMGKATYGQTPIVITRKGKKVAVLLNFDDFDHLLRCAEIAEDAYWGKVAQERLQETEESSEESIPAEELYRELGI